MATGMTINQVVDESVVGTELTEEDLGNVQGGFGPVLVGIAVGMFIRFYASDAY